MGAFGYADDIILLAPTRHSLQIMLNICQNFAEKHDMLFSTDPEPKKSKTKCLYFSAKAQKINPTPVILNNNPLPWVEKAKHLGNELTTDISLTSHSTEFCHDLLVKRAIFFSRVHSLKQEFSNAPPRLVCELLRIYGTSFFGSVLWTINSSEYSKLVKSWNTAVKSIWNLPYQTHTFFIEHLTDFPHLQSMLHSRFVGFCKSLQSSKKFHVKALFDICKNDQRTVTGENLKFLTDKYCAFSIQQLFDKKQEIFQKTVDEIPLNDEWKINFLIDVLSMRDDKENPDSEMTGEEMEDIIEYITTS